MLYANLAGNAMDSAPIALPKSYFCECGHIANYGFSGSGNRIACYNCKWEIHVPIKPRLCMCGYRIPDNNHSNVYLPLLRCQYCLSSGENKHISLCKCGRKMGYGNFRPRERFCCNNCKLLRELEGFYSKKLISCVSEDRIKKCPCGITTNYGFPGKRRVACTRCKVPGQINLSATYCKCGTVASYGYSGTRKRESCFKCKVPGQIQLNTRKRRTKKDVEKACIIIDSSSDTEEE